MSESAGGPGRREVAYRLFAAEYDGADLSYSESDEERAPNYVVTPSGARVNRLFLVGVLTEVETVSEDYLRARVVDPTGPFVVYAGQYQPEAVRFLEDADPPTFVAVTGKARTFQPEDADRVYTSIRPESINAVDAATRDRWVIQAAEATLDRVARAAAARASGLAGDDRRASLEAADVDEGLASGIPTAFDHYGTTGTYLAALRDVALDALCVVAGERDEVGATVPAPDAGDDDPIPDIAGEALEPVPADASAEPAAEPPGEDAPEPQSSTEAEQEPQSPSEGESATAAPDRTEAEATLSERAETEPAGRGTDAEADATTAEAGEARIAAAGETGEADTTAEDAGRGDEADASGDLDDFEIDDAERQEIESEYGTEFRTGTEVEAPGETDIETPGPAGGSAAEPGVEGGEGGGPAADDAAAATPESGTAAETDTGADTGAAAETDTGADTETADTEAAGAAASTAEATDVDLDDAVMDAMTDLDDGEGADREAVIGAVVDRTGADAGDVEDAIQGALMDGRCYEPDDGTLMAI